jgi:RNA polymerase sigma-70 factor (ECF subfamily)
LDERLAWDEQVRSNGRRFYHVAYRILGDSEAAADACQQAFCRAWSSRGLLRNPQALGGWIYRAVVNESYQWLRRRRVRETALRSIDARELDPESQQASWETRRALASGLAVLPDKTRAVVVFRLVYGLSGNEVKERLGLSAPEVSRRLHAGMESLRQSLTRELDLRREGGK